MKKKHSKKALTLIELLMVCTIMGFMLVPTIGMMSEAFNAQVGIEGDIHSKQSKAGVEQVIFSKLIEASSVYYFANNLSILINGTMVTLSPEENAIAVLIPQMDDDGNVIQPSTNVTSFLGVAFSIVPASSWGDNSDKYVLLESEADFDLQVSSVDPLQITQSLPDQWSTATTYLVADNLMPAEMTNLGTTAFDVENNIVSYAFVPQDGLLYFPAPDGIEIVDDSQFLTSCMFRNFRNQ